jgi:hypothetical protein
MGAKVLAIRYDAASVFGASALYLLGGEPVAVVDEAGGGIRQANPHAKGGKEAAIP